MDLADWFKGFEKGGTKGAILFGMRKALRTVRNASGL